MFIVWLPQVPLEFNLTASPRHANPNGIPVMKTQAEREASAATGARYVASVDLAQASEAYRKRVAVQVGSGAGSA